MKIETKTMWGITSIGIVTILIFGLIYVKSMSSIMINSHIAGVNDVIREVSHHVDSYLEEKIFDAQTFATMPVIIEKVNKSNKQMDRLTLNERRNLIKSLNDKWMQTEDISDPFIQSYFNNSVSQFLRKLQQMFPELYGEIFITNKYGAMIATTGRLTTLAHSHKYWWKEAYNNGKGKVFLDDRGYDKSVKRNVLGIVVPVFEENDIIGIMKLNILTTEQLSNFVSEMSSRHQGKVKITRLDGDILAERGVASLTKSLQIDTLKKSILAHDVNVLILKDSINKVIAHNVIPITVGNAKIGFGGKKSSFDQTGGSPTGKWHVIIERDLSSIQKPLYDTAKIVILAGIITTLIISYISQLFSRMIARPITSLTKIARKIGEGNLSIEIPIDKSSNELKELGESLKQMTQNLQETMASRDELEEALKNVKTLGGLVPICSHCKKIRDDKGYWNQLEQYISEHTDALFSHSICESCVEEHYKNNDWYKDYQKSKRD